MSVAKRLVIVLLLHLAFYICFPDVGRFGVFYGWISVVIWSVVAIFAETTFQVLHKIFGPLKILVDLAFIFVVAITIASTFPQEDRVSPLRKIKRGTHPNKTDFYRGLEKLGVKVKKETSPAIKQIKKRGQELGQELKEIEQ